MFHSCILARKCKEAPYYSSATYSYLPTHSDKAWSNPMRRWLWHRVFGWFIVGNIAWFGGGISYAYIMREGCENLRKCTISPFSDLVQGSVEALPITYAVLTRWAPFGPIDRLLHRVARVNEESIFASGSIVSTDASPSASSSDTYAKLLIGSYIRRLHRVVLSFIIDWYQMENQMHLLEKSTINDYDHIEEFFHRRRKMVPPNRSDVNESPSVWEARMFTKWFGFTRKPSDEVGQIASEYVADRMIVSPCDGTVLCIQKLDGKGDEVSFRPQSRPTRLSSLLRKEDLTPPDKGKERWVVLLRNGIVDTTPIYAPITLCVHSAIHVPGCLMPTNATFLHWIPRLLILNERVIFTLSVDLASLRGGDSKRWYSSFLNHNRSVPVEDSKSYPGWMVLVGGFGFGGCSLPWEERIRMNRVLFSDSATRSIRHIYTKAPPTFKRNHELGSFHAAGGCVVLVMDLPTGVFQPCVQPLDHVNGQTPLLSTRELSAAA